MKVVLFCGGLGLRIREASPRLPKPMVRIGGRPILWHIMKYYSHFGHRDFVVCLGYKGHAIEEYFSGRLAHREGWQITFVDTGLEATVGERLLAAREHVEGEELFLANYADTLTNAPLPTLIENVRSTDAVAGFLCARPKYTFHTILMDDDGVVDRLTDIGKADMWINGGYFVLRAAIFDYLRPGEDLVDGALTHLAARRLLRALPYDGFWLPMDTLKEKQELEEYARGAEPPWQLWAQPNRSPVAPVPTL